MHISEGILSPPVLAFGGLVAAMGVGYGLKKIREDQLVSTAILAAGFFVASLVHFSFGPVSVHLTFNALLGVLLGSAAFPAIFVGLLLQALLFGYGGPIVLGVNTVTMALPAVFFGYLFHPLFLLKSSFYRGVSVFVCVITTLVCSSLLYVLALVLSGVEFMATAKLAFYYSIPVFLIEGVASVVIVSILFKTRPDFFSKGFLGRDN